MVRGAGRLVRGKIGKGLGDILGGALKVAPVAIPGLGLAGMLGVGPGLGFLGKLGGGLLGKVGGAVSGLNPFKAGGLGNLADVAGYGLGAANVLTGLSQQRQAGRLAEEALARERALFQEGAPARAAAMQAVLGGDRPRPDLSHIFADVENPFAQQSAPRRETYGNPFRRRRRPQKE